MCNCVYIYTYVHIHTHTYIHTYISEAAHIQDTVIGEARRASRAADVTGHAERPQHFIDAKPQAQLGHRTC